METVKAELKKTEEESLMTRRQIDVEVGTTMCLLRFITLWIT